jgi:AcrR family transcriptional regulator
MRVASKNNRPVGRPPDADLQERRRAEILDAATAVFSKCGFAAADVQEIADKTGVGKGTIYRYFPSKEELFLAAVDHGMRNLKLAVDAAAASAKQPLDRIAEGVLAYLTFFDERPEIVELLVQERANFRDRQRPTYFVHREANMGPWQDLYGELIRSGTFRDMPVDRIGGRYFRFALWNDVHQLFRRPKNIAGQPMQRCLGYPLSRFVGGLQARFP